MKVAGQMLSGEALAIKHKEQNVLFQSCLADDPNFAKQVRSLELMLRVRDRLSGSSFPGSGGCSNKFPMMTRLSLRHFLIGVHLELQGILLMACWSAWRTSSAG